MSVRSLPTSRPSAVSQRVAPDEVRIGADIVELITSGMYVSPITVFREYVQNAADAIDDAREAGVLTEESGQVDIEIDHAERSVSIRDNGCGVLSSTVSDVLLAIGGSSKRGTAARGYRGVGRLSGLAYCRELVFRTKALGETVETTVTLDARALRSGITAARSGTDLREVVASAVSITRASVSEREAHFFEVTLRGVVRHRQDILINEHAIAHYLAQVAPVPFSGAFSYGARIEERLRKWLPARSPIRLTVAGESIERPYRNSLTQPGTDKTVDVREIEFFELTDVDGNLGAVGWLGHHDYVRSISTSLGVRGLRARVGDIQVGESDLFDGSFKEARFNGWTVGEVHIVDRRILPNGRRDNFEVNNHSNNLLVQLGPVTANLSHRCRISSVSRNATMIIRNTIAEVQQVLDGRQIEGVRLSRCLAAVKRGTLKLRGVEDLVVRQELELELSRLEQDLISRRPSESAGVVAADEAVALVNKIVTNREQASQLIEALRNLRG